MANGGKRVLVVEDESLVAMLIEGYLEGLSHKSADAASQLDEALVLARTLDLDMALLDVNLGGEPRYPAAKAEQIERGGYGHGDHLAHGKRQPNHTG